MCERVLVHVWKCVALTQREQEQVPISERPGIHKKAHLVREREALGKRILENVLAGPSAPHTEVMRIRMMLNVGETGYKVAFNLCLFLSVCPSVSCQCLFLSREIISSRSAEHLQNIFLPINRQMRQESN